jgi:predicted dinucleotide-binding enzyme
LCPYIRSGRIYEIGLIGAGTVAQAVAKYLVAVDYEVLISNSRGPASLSDVAHILGPKVRAVETSEFITATGTHRDQ